MELIKNNVKVAWVNLGEGLRGDYNPGDPEDIELLRFDVLVLVDGAWTDPGDASYCTRFPVKSTIRDKGRALAHILDEVYGWASDGHSIKKMCERLSWIDPSWVRKAE